jgi:hypothetical protein
MRGSKLATRLPGVDLDALKATVAQELGATPATDAGGPFAFFESVTNYAIQWLQNRVTDLSNQTPAVFLLSASPANEVLGSGFIRVRAFTASLTRSLDSYLFVAAENLSVVWASKSAASSLDDLTSEIDRMGLGDRVAVVLLPAERAIGLCMNGVNGKCIRVSIPEHPSLDMQLSEFDHILWRFHEEFTQAPEGHLIPWEKAKERIPAPQLERRIQNLLWYHLKFVIFGNKLIIKEGATVKGRIDIHVQAGVLGPSMGSCVLELKVLRTHFPGASGARWSEKQNVDHVIEGIDQALDYQSETGAKIAFLCCYDARSVSHDQELPNVPDECRAKSVHYRRYYMFSSTPERRRAARAAAKKGELLAGQPK